MANILYISLTGMTEALGESQVVQYLLPLAANHRIFLLSFEKRATNESFLRLQAMFDKSNITWHYFTYSNRYGIFSSASQLLHAIWYAWRLSRRESIQVIHARSLIPAYIGRFVKTWTRAKLLFDMRGFAIDEKIVDGRLKEGAFLTKILRKIERNTYRSADHVVTLTHRSKPMVASIYKLPESRITVIPTCANRSLFYPLPEEKRLELRRQFGFGDNNFIILHNGSLNGWYDFAAQLKVYHAFLKLKPETRFLILNHRQHDLIKTILAQNGIAETHYRLFSADFKSVNLYLNAAHLSIFFVKPSFAKAASAPTKFAEQVAAHLPTVTNTDYGDMEFYLNHFPVGQLVDLEAAHQAPDLIAKQVLAWLTAHQASFSNSRCFEELFDKFFSKDVAILQYQAIYHQLCGEGL